MEQHIVMPQSLAHANSALISSPLLLAYVYALRTRDGQCVALHAWERLPFVALLFAIDIPRSFFSLVLVVSVVELHCPIQHFLGGYILVRKRTVNVFDRKRPLYTEEEVWHIFARLLNVECRYVFHWEIENLRFLKI